jgi:hypothetical protein
MSINLGVAIVSVVLGGYNQNIQKETPKTAFAFLGAGSCGRRFIIEEIKFPAMEMAKIIDIGVGSMRLDLHWESHQP